MNKKTIFTIFLLFFLITAGSATNNQKYYSHDSIEYKQTLYLSRLAGISGPTLITPASGSELLLKLKQIEVSDLPYNAQKVLKDLIRRIENPQIIYLSENFKTNLNLNINIEAIGHTEKSQRSLESLNSTLQYQYKDRLPFVDLENEIFINDSMYGKGSLTLKRRYIAEYLNNPISFNLSKNFGDGYQLVSPFDVGISIGNEDCNFILARGNLNIGQGLSGNLFISDNFLFQDFFKLSFFTKVFQYYFTYTHFDQQTSHTSLKPWMSVQGEHQIRLSHTYSFNISPKVMFAFHEGTLVQAGNALDPRFLNPFIFMHNWQGFLSEDKWANNFVAIEFQGSITKGLGFNFQFIVDQIQMPGEIANGGDLHPNAMGTLFNIGHIKVLSEGFLHAYIESVWTSPYLYLNYLTKAGIYDENMTINRDLILGYYLSYGYDLSYTGYKHGPGTIAIILGSDFSTFDDKLNLHFEFQYRIHGQKGIQYSANQNDSPELGIEHVMDILPYGIWEHTISIGSSAQYSLTKHLSFFTTLTYIHRINDNNVKGKDIDDFQWSFAISLLLN